MPLIVFLGAGVGDTHPMVCEPTTCPLNLEGVDVSVELELIGN